MDMAHAGSSVLNRSVLFREFLFALVPIAALVVAFQWRSYLLLDYVHVITGGTWTGIDLSSRG